MDMALRVVETKRYSSWFKGLRDVMVKRQIVSRMDRIAYHGSLIGDFKSLGGGLVELRFDTGPGYRAYVSLNGDELLLLLLGGDKSTQASDIEKARKLLKKWRTEHA